MTIYSFVRVMNTENEHGMESNPWFLSGLCCRTQISV